MALNISRVWCRYVQISTQAADFRDESLSFSAVA
jgi:hypothetical protein